MTVIKLRALKRIKAMFGERAAFIRRIRFIQSSFQFKCLAETGAKRYFKEHECAGGLHDEAAVSA
jgi:hypothetical protein